MMIKEVVLGSAESYQQFVSDVEPKLRLALVASLGQDRGLDATAEALAYGWEHWERVRAMVNPAGYLYRVGRSRFSRIHRIRPIFCLNIDQSQEVEPALPGALASLSEKQRVAVVMVHAYAWSRAETADLLGISVSTLDTHLQRALQKLRKDLGVTDVN